MVAAALPLEGALAPLNMALGALLHFLDVVAGIVHVLLAECTDHGRGLHVGMCPWKANVRMESRFLPRKRNDPPKRGAQLAVSILSCAV